MYRLLYYRDLTGEEVPSFLGMPEASSLFLIGLGMDGIPPTCTATKSRLQNTSPTSI
tara:strand:+ start:94 stop:264 length:171 start_codon:yes stop_codon:yes gene_type:complete